MVKVLNACKAQETLLVFLWCCYIAVKCLQVPRETNQQVTSTPTLSHCYCEYYKWFSAVYSTRTHIYMPSMFNCAIVEQPRWTVAGALSWVLNSQHLAAVQLYYTYVQQR